LFDQLPVPDQSGTDLFCKHGFACQSLDIASTFTGPSCPSAAACHGAYTRCSSRTNKLPSSRSGTPRSFSILHPQIILLCVDRTPHAPAWFGALASGAHEGYFRKDATLLKP
jgi:hypothetical protein